MEHNIINRFRDGKSRVFDVDGRLLSVNGNPPEELKISINAEVKEFTPPVEEKAPARKSKS